MLLDEFLESFIVKCLDGKEKIDLKLCCFYKNYSRKNYSLTEHKS